jgi:Ca2+-binding RTX toxin-like protein
MATYIVTNSTWNDPRFWAALDGSGGGHTLSFADLPPGYSIDFDEAMGRIVLTDGQTSFIVGDARFSGPADALLPGRTTLADFATILGAQGGDRIAAADGHSRVEGGAGDDLVTGGTGSDRLSGGGGNDILAGDAATSAIVAETDFTDGVPSWITTPEGKPVGELSKLDDGNVFLGPFAGDGEGSEAVRATIDFAKGTDRGVVTFDFVRLDSWDDSVEWGLDERLTVYVNGKPAFDVRPFDIMPSGSFDGGRWEVWPATETTGLGGNSAWTDRIHSVRIVLDDPPPSVTIGWGANTNQSIRDESWGIDAFRAVSMGAPADGATGDTLSGGDGADLILGGYGDDRLEGGCGADSFEGGAGNDTITTGWGERDTIVLTRGGGTDIVTDFARWNWNGATEDRIDISRLRGGSGPDGRVVWRDIVVSRTTDGDAVLDFPEGERLVLLGVPPEQFQTRHAAQATGIPCFTAGTLIRTLSGEVPIERLRPGDMVLTRDNGPQPLRWVAMRRIGAAELLARPELRPVRIAPGALGNARPLLVSPQHGLLVSLAERGGAEGLARAIQLARMRGGKVRVAAGVRAVSYLHLAFDRHEIVFSNGLASESFYPGHRALAALSIAARREFGEIFPDLAAFGAPARTYLRRTDLPPDPAALSAARP